MNEAMAAAVRALAAFWHNDLDTMAADPRAMYDAATRAAVLAYLRAVRPAWHGRGRDAMTDSPMTAAISAAAKAECDFRNYVSWVRREAVAKATVLAYLRADLARLGPQAEVQRAYLSGLIAEVSSPGAGERE